MRKARYASRCAKPPRIQLRPPVLHEQTIGVRRWNLTKIQIRDEDRLLQTRRSRQHDTIGTRYERLAGKRQALFGADAVAQRNEVAILKSGDAHLRFVQ